MCALLTLFYFNRMKRLLLIIAIALSLACQAQGIAETPNEFYTETLVGEQEPTPYPYLRESDVVWATTIWKSIDLNEAFNQFIYFPIDSFFVEGRTNLANLLWNAIVADEIPIFEDDELKIPLDNAVFVKGYTKADTIMLEIGYADDDEEEYTTVIRPKFFESEEIYRFALREVWFIGKADSRLDSRRIALAPMKESSFELGNSGIIINNGIIPIFWVPMQNMAVRRLLARNTAYPNKWNTVGQPSWDMIFLSQYYQAYITRESNVYNRRIDQYLTGEDAILESEAIEAKVFDIGDDMWEY